MKPEWIDHKAKAFDAAASHAALERQQTLTKPSGSLGRLEDLVVRLAGLQGTVHPHVDKIRISVFAADHGVAAEGVSLFPQAVTAEMIRNFSRGGAAISVAARALGASLEVIDVGAVTEMEPLPGVIQRRIAAGTENMVLRPAMDGEALAAALAAGKEVVERAVDDGAQLFVGGEMGIANTTAATAVACALLGESPEALVGPGTGLDSSGMHYKAAVIRRALQLHAPAQGDAWEALRCLGGFEIGALVGAYIRCAQLGLVVLVDGFICIAAALIALRLQPTIAPWLFYAHASTEPGYARIAKELDVQPLLHLEMHLGEGSGAAVAVPILRMACALHNEMATFSEAGVSESNE